MKDNFLRGTFRKRIFILIIGSLFCAGHLMAANTPQAAIALSTNGNSAKCLQVSFFFLGLGVKMFSNYIAGVSIDEELFALDSGQEKDLVPPIFTGKEGASNLVKGVATGLTEAVKTYIVSALLSKGLPQSHVSILISAFTAGSSFQLFYKTLEKITLASKNVGKSFDEALMTGVDALLEKAGLVNQGVQPITDREDKDIKKILTDQLEDVLLLQGEIESATGQKVSCDDAFTAAMIDLLSQGGVLTFGALISVLGTKIGALASRVLVANLLGTGASALHKTVDRYAELSLVVFLGRLLFNSLHTVAESYDHEHLKKTVLLDEQKFITTVLASSLGVSVYRFILPKEMTFLKNLGISLPLI